MQILAMSSTLDREDSRLRVHVIAVLRRDRERPDGIARSIHVEDAGSLLRIQERIIEFAAGFLDRGSLVEAELRATCGGPAGQGGPYAAAEGSRLIRIGND